MKEGHLPPRLQFPAIAGHEGAGIVRAIGSEVRDKTLRAGDAVLLSFAACSKCEQCGESKPAKCDGFLLNLGASRWADESTPAKLLDGRPVGAQFFGQSSFSRISVVHESCVVRCPYPDDLAIYAPMGCGYQTGAGTVLNILKPRSRHTLAIFGMGSVGFAAMMAAASLSLKEIIAIDIVEKKLTLAQSLGATRTVDSSKLQRGIVEEIRELTGGRGVDFAIDTTGVPSVIEGMLDCLAVGGTAASIGAPPPGINISVDVGTFFFDGKTWLSVAEGDSNPPEVRTHGRLVNNSVGLADNVCSSFPSW